MPRPRLHRNQADKQHSYRQRQSDKRLEERQLADRAKGLLEIAASRGQVLRVDLPLWAQLDELAQWLRSN